MAIDLTGIHNVNEFYTDHYLATYFEQSVTETLRAWRADAEASGGQTPYQRLRDAGKLYGRLYGRSRNTGRGHAAEDAAEMIAAYLESLGYPDSPQERIPLPSGEVLPLFREAGMGDLASGSSPPSPRERRTSSPHAPWPSLTLMTRQLTRPPRSASRRPSTR